MLENELLPLIPVSFYLSPIVIKWLIQGTSLSPSGVEERDKEGRGEK